MLHPNLSFFDFSNRENKELYYSFKKREQKNIKSSLTELEINQLIESKIKEGLAIVDFDIIVYPETTNIAFLNILKTLRKPLISIEKRNNGEIKKVMESVFGSLEKRLEVDSEKAKFFGMSPKERTIVGKYLYKDLDKATNKRLENKKILYIDDGMFSGTTFKNTIVKLDNFKDNLTTCVVFSYFK